MRDTAEASGEEIDILVCTDVLSEGQNLQDCGVLINYDLTWNPIRLVQRSGRIDRLRSPHEKIGIWNMMPEAELEELLKLVERLNERIGILAAEAKVETKGLIATANDPIQSTLAVEIKAAMRDQKIDRDRAKSCLEFLRQPIGRAVATRLKAAHAEWSQSGDTPALLDKLLELAADYGKAAGGQEAVALKRDELELVCFEFVG